MVSELRDGSEPSLGAVHMFARVGGAWVELQKIKAPDGVSGQREFGASVALDVDRLAVGAPFHGDCNGCGAASVFTVSGFTWGEPHRLVACAADRAELDEFGTHVAIDGDRIVVGSPQDDDGYPPENSDRQSGSAYVFQWDGSTWADYTKLTESDPAGPDGPAPQNNFGRFAQIAGDLVIVSAPYDDTCTRFDTGAVFVFDVSGAACNDTPLVCPDCNGDGIPDECEADCDGDGSIDARDPLDHVVFTQQPADTALCEGGTVVFDVDADGEPPLTYQWRREGANLSVEPGHTSGANVDLLIISAAILSDAGTYDCVVTNICGGAVSDAAELQVEQLPQIVEQPDSVRACELGSAQFHVEATGGGLQYQWRHNEIELQDGGPIRGARTPALTIGPVCLGHAGNYRCIVSNRCGTAESQVATLTMQRRGDANCDGVMNNFDIDCFVFAVVDAGRWARRCQQNGCDYLCAADIDEDGRVTNFDIDPFVDCLLRAGCLCP